MKISTYRLPRNVLSVNSFRLTGKKGGAPMGLDGLAADRPEGVNDHFFGIVEWMLLMSDMGLQ
jgi:hypothetical protein